MSNAPAPCAPGPGGGSPAPGAFDPNEKFGAAGFGPRAFIAQDVAIPYRVTFENLGPGSVPTPEHPAPAPAQRVEITDQLSANLDWETFRFTEFGFGDTVITVPDAAAYYFHSQAMRLNDKDFNVEVEMSFDSANGLLRLVFQSLDPLTELPPPVLTGFLPPEDGTARGKGYVSYRVRPRAGLATGTEIRNVALIKFDINPVIATNQVDPEDPGAGTSPDKEALNTIDAGVPTSSVESLPTVSPGMFLIRWSGSDDAGGSGVAAFDVLVSDNGGPFLPLLTATTLTSTTFTGQDSHRYGFISVATDAVGHVQPMPATAQATTRIDAVAPTSRVAPLPAVTSTTGFPVSWSGEDNAGGSGLATFDVLVSDNGGPFVPFLTGTMQMSAMFMGEFGHTYGFVSVATDVAGSREAMPSAAQATTRLVAAPTSSVNLLAAVTPSPTFTVSWSGTPGVGGDAIASFDVFVSDNGGPFTAFQTATTQTLAVFAGAAGHRYGFFSVATDNHGIRQLTPTNAQAITVVSVPLPPPPEKPRATGATLIPRGKGRKKILVAVVSFTGGRPALEIVSPFPKTAFQAIQVALQDLDKDGTPESLVFSARKGRKKFSRSLLL
jgi:hypothetical protein